MPQIKFTDLRVIGAALIMIVTLLGIFGYNFEPAIAEKVRLNSKDIAREKARRRENARKYVELNAALNNLRQRQAVNKERASIFELQTRQDIKDIKTGQKEILSFIRNSLYPAVRRNK